MTGGKKMNDIQSAAPTLEGKNIILVPPYDEGLYKLYEWEKDISSRFLWTGERELPNEFEFQSYFVNKLRNEYHTFLFINSKKSNESIGFIYSSNYNPIDGFLNTTIFINKEKRHGAVGAEAGVLFYDYLFKYYPIRKIYSNAYDYNKVSLSFLKSGGFVVEGKLVHHRFFAGKYHDLNLLALYRDTFYEKCSRIIERFQQGLKADNI